MRPKKHILLIDDKDHRRGWRAFAIETNGLRVTQAEKPIYQGSTPVNLVIAVWPFEPAVVETLAVKLQARLMVIWEADDEPGFDEPGFIASDSRLCNPSMQELLERAKMLTTLRRGARKGVKRGPATVEPEMAIA